jgi:antitoxin HigA-1
VTFFADKRTAQVARRGAVRGVPDKVVKRAARQIDIVSAATRLQETRFAGHGRIAKLPRSKPPRFYLHVDANWWLGFNWNALMPTTSNLRRRNNSVGATEADTRRPTDPGEILREEFLNAYGITQDRLAEAMGVSRFRINEVINGKRAITAETALLLAAALDTTAEFWLNLQRAVDLHEGRVRLASDLKRVKPLIRKNEDEIFYNFPNR